MSTYPRGTQYIFKVDQDQLQDTPTGTPDLQILCHTDIAITDNEGLSTFNVSCDDGATQNIVTTIDKQWDLTVKGDTDDTLIIDILKARDSLDKRNRASIEVTDNITSVTKTYNASITAISDTRSEADTVEFSITFKSRGAATS